MGEGVIVGRRMGYAAALIAVAGTFAPVGAGCVRPPPSPGVQPITVTELLQPDGSPLHRAEQVNEAGDVLAEAMWLDSETYGPPEWYLWRHGDSTHITAEWDFLQLNDLSERGQVVGTTNHVFGRNHALSWRDGRWTELDDRTGLSLAEVVNDRGVILGELIPQAAAWDDEGDVTVAPTTLDVEVIDINERGQALLDVGPPNSRQAAVWQVGGDLTMLGTLGGNRSRGSDINDAGEVTGTSVTAAGDQHAFVWRGGRMTDLGTMGGGTSTGRAINEAGQVVGSAEDAAEQTHAVKWDDGELVDLGGLGGRVSYALAVNDHGQVIGQSSTGPEDERHAFLWADGRMTDLNALVSSDSDSGYAVDINDQGQIVGWVNDRGLGHSRAILWTSPPQR
jgi:probable HAF family extracellular repeat protein